MMRGSWGKQKPPVGSVVNTAHPLAQVLVGCWLFNENAGTIAKDVSGWSNTGTLTNFNWTSTSGWVPGDRGPVLRPDGTNDFVSIPASSSLNLSSAFSIAIRFNPTATGGNGLFEKTVGGSVNTQYSMFLTGGKLVGRIKTVGADITGTTTILAGSWYSGLFTYDGTNERLYINGHADATAVASANASAGSGIALIGSLSGVFPFSGQIDYVYVFSRALTPSDALNIYNNPFAMIAPPPATKFYSYAAVSAGGIAFDAASNSGYQALTGAYSWSHTCTGTNRFLSVDISMLSVPGTTVTGITYNGVAMSFIGARSTVSGAGRVEQWGLVNPASGTNNITATFTALITSAGTAVSYTNVNQSVPTEAFNSAQATNVGAADASVVITTIANNDWVHGAIATDDTAITANQTPRNNVTGSLGSGADEDTGPIAVAGATTISYTNVGAGNTWAIAGYGIRPVFAPSGVRAWWQYARSMMGALAGGPNV